MNTYLLLDIGNSNIKVALSSHNRFRFLKSVTYFKNNFKKILSDIIEDCKFPIKSAGISLTDFRLQPDAEKVLRKSGIRDFIFTDKSIKLPIKINYKSRLGSDRICGAVAASSLFPKRKNILYVDFGTATTYNLIINKVFEGGMITPGVLTSLKSLIRNTSLPDVKLSAQFSIVNKNTLSNIKAGVYFNTLYSFERIVNELKKKHRNLFVIVTGGMSRLIIKNTNLISEIDNNLVLKGIDIILKFNEYFQSK